MCEKVSRTTVRGDLTCDIIVKIVNNTNVSKLSARRLTMKSYRIPQLASGYIEYDMIKQYTELPAFPNARVHLLYIFLNKGSRISFDQTELYALVTSLIQIGLDTHETIDTEQGNQAENLMRSRQLKVLAGDYYSSIFYQLLSDVGQIEVITSLSKAICDLNMMKMNHYISMQNSLLSSEQYLVQKVQLNMQLFLSFSPLLQDSVRGLWSFLLHEISLCETIMQELSHNQGACPLHSTEYMISSLRESIGHIQHKLHSLEGDLKFDLHFLEEIGQVVEPFVHLLNSSGTVLREG